VHHAVPIVQSMVASSLFDTILWKVVENGVVVVAVVVAGVAAVSWEWVETYSSFWRRMD
jgi:hypothetical protein